ncbi:hypothetical protein WKW77_25510 [Variovorax ureilyticus]|uniref:TRAP-type C4-dicarboxylate transport system, small permease component n=1 Tax=Variovorax ureilyticus TaxID=1836198 RepID=A0ABU8VLE3_9BURK
MEHAESGTAHGLKERAIEELKIYWIITLYLWVLLGLFTVYRRLVEAETGVIYLHYGIALIEALVIAKVVLIGKLFGFSRRFEDRALIVPVIYKSVLFGLLVMLFGVLEHLIAGWIHKQGLLGGLQEIASIGRDELVARTLMLVVAFVPFFSFCELGRVLGMKQLTAMFLSNPKAWPLREDASAHKR